MTTNSTWDALAELKAELQAQTKRITALTEKVAAQEAELNQLKAVSHQPSAATMPTPDTRSSRRQMLRKMGAVAATLAVAGAIAGPKLVQANDGGRGKPKTNASGGNLIINAENMDTTATDGGTILENDPAFTRLQDYQFWADNSRDLSLFLPSNTRIALAGTSQGSDSSATISTKRIGVYGYVDGQGYGVWGAATATGNGIGVYATAVSNSAVLAYSTGSFGVVGQSDTDTAIVGVSTAKYGAAFNGALAPINLVASSTSSAPSSGLHTKGEIYVDQNGAFYICVADGTPGTWRKIGGTTTAGTLHVLPSPDRFVDTRSFVASGDAPGIITAGNSRSFKVLGTPGVNSVQIPANTLAITGNLTAVPVSTTVGGGFLQLYADGAAAPPVANLNYTATSGPVGNSFVCAVSSAGRVRVFAFKDAHVIIDITGYYL